MNRQLTAVIPLESNPDVFDKFAYNLGLDTSYNFNDIFSIDDPSLLEFLPRPMVAIVLLFPIQKNKPAVGSAENKGTTPIWLKQNFKNACGLYALLHILVNNKHLLTKGSALLEYLESNDGHVGQNIDQFIVDFIDTYKQDFIQSSGDSQNPDPEDTIELHFISFISYGEKLWELDGRAVDGKPLCLGEVQKKNAAQVDLIDELVIFQRIQSYMSNVERESDKMSFSLLGLSKSWE
ncbi:ubiquitin-specific protease YUH1 KNAG_0D01330 [Huiozyma naganishii CBS 8797]|uniref:Ubiquitin carboxyl-terminal hydrolase n=1 Tax=Huiozyma naganishii (strain ATCC MYA-139 / BCRC 22969 / CBS 8797 / KCTC 17520 / NBRC 10181 / NCYC 3082 / Yp74L-3) TaxID=1071383 RepID=J7R4W2_HUIN7|nr:hypothetical protein KNAG_0D01330 [Kazachstania naganishii CBS 8797]CCK69885.1 hypothetical protein KNAG_0D01330 [Kazachstania naganishii CBS 8797]